MSEDFNLVCPFWIDTEAYSDRDRMMFVAGFEFCQILRLLSDDIDRHEMTIHRENESRVRMAASKFGRVVQIEACGFADDPAGTWAYLTIGPDLKEGKKQETP